MADNPPLHICSRCALTLTALRDRLASAYHILAVTLSKLPIETSAVTMAQLSVVPHQFVQFAAECEQQESWHA
jgi:hypothetical protein